MERRIASSSLHLILLPGRQFCGSITWPTAARLSYILFTQCSIEWIVRTIQLFHPGGSQNCCANTMADHVSTARQTSRSRDEPAAGGYCRCPRELEKRQPHPHLPQDRPAIRQPGDLCNSDQRSSLHGESTACHFLQNCLKKESLYDHL